MTTESISPGEEKLERAERFHPPRAADLRDVALPIREVTLLEDRAQVTRRGRVALSAGRNRLMVDDVAPVLQDVSLRAELQAGDARVIDLRARRAVRVRAVDKPELARELEQQLADLERRFVEATEDRERAEQRYNLLLQMIGSGMDEIPEDAAWGLVNHQVWHESFETLSKRARTQLERASAQYFSQLDVAEEAAQLIRQRRAFDRQDMDLVGWLELDIDAPQEVELELTVEYVAPNALWRPIHSARLDRAGTVRFVSSAAVWQNTGEDWRDVALSFSTARSSLGTEPPLLADDLLTVQRRSERVRVEQRQVAVQTAGLGRDEGRAEPPAARPLQLPGVDDGGDVQNLRALASSSVPSDGRLNVVPVFEFEGEAERQLVCMPELAPKVFLKALLTNESASPILAGPVELLRDNGFVGWTKVLFVAPGERFELSFGHDDALRVYRTQRHESEADEVDRWTHNDALVSVSLSNLEGATKQIEVVERIPVAEIEYVRVEMLEAWCQPDRPQLDDNGFCRWRVELPPNGTEQLRLGFRVSTAPEVEGI